MSDDLRSTIEAAVAAEEAKQPEPVSAPASSPAPSVPPAPPPAEAPASPDEELEELAKKSDPTSEGGSEKSQKPLEGRQPEAGPPVAPPPPSEDKAPQSWKVPAKAKWDKVDPEIRQEIRRREREIEKTMGDTAQARRFTNEFHQAVAPFAPRYQALNVSPVQALRGLMQIDHVLAMGTPAQKAKQMAQLVKDYGVGIADLDSALAGEDVQDTKPETIVDRIVQERLRPFNQFIEQQTAVQQAAAQRDFQEQVRTVEAMAQNPKYPHFDMVRDDIADLIEVSAKRKVALSLEEAYNRAILMNPEANRLTQEAAKQKKAHQAHSDAARALGASLSVGGAPASLKGNLNPSDLRGTIEAAVAAHSGR